jgi:hypothetical protein
MDAVRTSVRTRRAKAAQNVVRVDIAALRDSPFSVDKQGGEELGADSAHTRVQALEMCCQNW